MDVFYVKEVFEEIKKEIRYLREKVNQIEGDLEECKHTLIEKAGVETEKVRVFQQFDTNFRHLFDRVGEIETYVYGEDTDED